MKEKVQEFEISINFQFPANMTIEAENEKEALKIAQKHYLEIIRDHLRDKDNLNIRVQSKHTITAEEREKLEQDGIIVPKKTKRTEEPKHGVPHEKFGNVRLSSFQTISPTMSDEDLQKYVEKFSLEGLRRRRSTLHATMSNWKKQGKEVGLIIRELEAIKQQIQKLK